MITSRHFKEKEFNACTPSCSLQDMKQSTMNRLDTLRDLAGIPLVINSAFRSPEHDRSKGRSGTGAHTLGQAVDIRCSTSENRFKIVQAAIKAGFTRIGIDKSFVHVDDSTRHPQSVVWLY